jgi:hypothetical protein
VAVGVEEGGGAIVGSGAVAFGFRTASGGVFVEETWGGVVAPDSG